METNKMKQTYEAPEIKVVAFQVEKGFATSLEPKGSEGAYQNYAGEQMTEETGWNVDWN